MNSLLAVFFGALVGAASPIAVIIIQQWFQTKRDRLKIASEIAIADYKTCLDLAKHTGAPVPPVSAYVIYHAMLLEELAKGEINEEKIKILAKKINKITDAFPGAPEK